MIPLPSTALNEAIAQVRYGVAKTEGLLVLVAELHRARAEEQRAKAALADIEVSIDTRYTAEAVESVEAVLKTYHAKETP